MKTDNKTLVGINNTSERFILFSWCLVVLVTSLFGDTIVLVATIRYNAIKLSNKVILVVIQHLAACNLIVAVFRLLPTTIAIAIDDWTIGDFLGHVQYHVSNFCFTATSMLTIVMSVLKLICLLCPLRTVSWSTQLGHRVCYSMWVLSLVILAPGLGYNLLYSRQDLVFTYRFYTCIYNAATFPPWLLKFYYYGYTTVITTTFGALFISSLLILVFARRAAVRHHEALRLEGVLIVILTVASFFVSYLPWFVAKSGKINNMVVYRVTYFLTFVNTSVNFFVYALSITSFRKFLRRKVFSLGGRYFREKFPEYAMPTSISMSLAHSTIERVGLQQNSCKKVRESRFSRKL